MTVYKGYLYVAKKNAGMFFLYLGIFFVITLLFQFMNQDTRQEGYRAERMSVALIDEDGGAMAVSLGKYLQEFHQVEMMEEDVAKLQEKMYYKEIDYIVRIPEHFYRQCILGNKKLRITQVPGSYTASYLEQQLNNYMNSAKTYAAAGFTEEENANAVGEHAEAQIDFLNQSRNDGNTEAYLFYFRYLPYLFLGVLGYVIGSMVASMRRGDLKMRMQASAVPQRRQSLEGLLACGTMALILWGIVIIVAMCFYGKEFVGNAGNLYYLLNSLALLCVAVSLSYLVGSLANGVDALNGMVNVLSLGMCFFGGAFVPLEVMNTGVKKVGQFLPIYWYETVNDLLGGYCLDVVWEKVMQGIGIQFLFAVAFVCVTLVIAKKRRTV